MKATRLLLAAMVSAILMVGCGSTEPGGEPINEKPANFKGSEGEVGASPGGNATESAATAPPPVGP